MHALFSELFSWLTCRSRPGRMELEVIALRHQLAVLRRGSYSWIHPGSANAVWWVGNMDAHSVVENERGGKPRRYRAVPDPEAHAKVHQLLREKYGVADRWVRFLEGTDTQSGIFTSGEKCKTVPIRLEPIPGAP